MNQNPSPSSPQISVIVPVYNVEKYVGKCIDSILAQTYSDFELILVDDGSSDGSAAVCREYAARDHRIIFLQNEKNSGVSYTRNRGLDIYRGEYVFFLDSDDWFDERMFEVMHSAIVEYDADFVACNDVKAILQKDGSFKYDPADYASVESKVDVLTLDSAMYRMRNKMPVRNKLLKRSIIDGLRFITSISYMEDVAFLLSALKNVEKAVFLSDSFYRYFVNRPGNVTSSAFNQRHIHLIDNQELLSDLYRELGYPSIAAYRKTRLMMSILSKIPKSQRNAPEYAEYIQKTKQMIDSIPRSEVRKMMFDKRLNNNGIKFFLLFARISFKLFCKFY